jgi:hypothetical protein
MSTANRLENRATHQHEKRRTAAFETLNAHQILQMHRISPWNTTDRQNSTAGSTPLMLADSALHAIGSYTSRSPQRDPTETLCDDDFRQ